MSDNAACVKSVLSEYLGICSTRVTEEATLSELGADSLDVIELVMAFEEEFGIEIPDELAEKILTVKDAIEAVQNLGGH